MGLPETPAARFSEQNDRRLEPLAAVADRTDVVELDELMRRIRTELSEEPEFRPPTPPQPAQLEFRSPTPPQPEQMAAPSFFQRLKRKRVIRSVVALRYGIPAIRLLPQVKERSERTEVRLLELSNAINSRMADAECKAKNEAAALRKILAEAAKSSHVEQLKARVAELERRESKATARCQALEDEAAALRKMLAEAAKCSYVEQLKERLAEVELRAVASVDQIAQLDRRMGATQSALATMEERLEASMSLSHSERIEMSDELSQMRTKLTNQWREAVNQKYRLDLLLGEARRRLPQVIDESQLGLVAGERDHALDAIYVSFQDRWRGTRADIKNRQRVYLSRVTAAIEATGRSLILDVGCGRGEWLELLQENGITGKGYDLNRIMVTECQERGLDVTLGDALEAVRAIPDDSVTAITGFHIIEHIPFNTIVNLFDESLRVLRPQGLVVFETPNPANLQVAAERFYFDPTHRNPLPSELVAFLAEARGFSRVEVIPLHPIDPPAHSEYTDPMLELMRQKLFGPQDYGVIAWKDR